MAAEEDSIEDAIPLAVSASDVNTHLAYLRRDIRLVSKKIDNLDNHYLSQSEFKPVADTVAAHDISIKELDSFKDGINGKLIGFGAAAAVFSSIMTIIISHYWH